MTLNHAGGGCDSRVARRPVYAWGTVEMNNDPDDEHHRLVRAIGDLTRELGRSPNASELAEHLGMDRDEVIENLTWRRSLSRGSAGEHEIKSGARGMEPGENLEVLEGRLAELSHDRGLPFLLGVLTDRERHVVLLRLAKSMSQSQIAHCLGVTPAEVSRILTRSLAMLRGNVEEPNPKA